MEYAEEMRKAEYLHAVQNLEEFAEAPMRKLRESIQVIQEQAREERNA